MRMPLVNLRSIRVRQENRKNNHLDTRIACKLPFTRELLDCPRVCFDRSVYAAPQHHCYRLLYTWW